LPKAQLKPLLELRKCNIDKGTIETTTRVAKKCNIAKGTIEILLELQKCNIAKGTIQILLELQK
jgi:hypothetical protein